MSILAVLKWYTVGAMTATAIIFFGIGLLYKMGMIAKQRKRILRLEDEMLSNHSNILNLEKKLAESRQQLDDLTGNNKKEHNLKIS